MARNTVERRGALRETLIEIAERKVAEGGISAVTARDLAKDAGCAVGAIYNSFPDMDAIVHAVNSRTVARLEAAVAEAFAGDSGSASPKRQLVLLGITYLAFVEAFPRLWSAVFVVGALKDGVLPDEQAAERTRLIGHVVRPLETLLPDETPERRVLIAKGLFSAVHGIVSLGRSRRFMAVPIGDIPLQISYIVEAFCDGVGRKD